MFLSSNFYGTEQNKQHVQGKAARGSVTFDLQKTTPQKKTENLY